MTGFGKSEAHVLTKKLTVEIRTLNSKSIDLNFRVPHIFRELEPQLRVLLNKGLTRGKIDVSVYVEGNSGENTIEINKEVIDDYIAQLQGIHQGETTELLKMAIRLPDALKTEKEDVKEDVKEKMSSQKLASRKLKHSPEVKSIKKPMQTLSQNRNMNTTLDRVMAKVSKFNNK